jgi:non-ribosomal peptide synthetase component F
MMVIEKNSLATIMEKELDNLGAAWKDTAESPTGETAAGHFEEQVRRAPKKTAVSLAVQIQPPLFYSYQTLNERANQLAHFLRDIGVRPGVFVGI